MRILWSVSVVLLLSGRASALTIELANATNGQLPEIEYPVDNDPLRLTINLRNESGQLSDPVLLWQIGFALLPVGDVTGTMTFSDLGPPASQLFGPEAQPLPLSDLQGQSLVATDVDPAFTGVSIDGSSAASILELQLQASENAAGSYLLAAVPYDAENVDQTSFWGRPDEQLFEFENQIGQSQFIELGLIVVSSDISPVGDYNGDGDIDAADYTVWRDGLDGKFQPEHYDTWRANYGQTPAGRASFAVAPEGTSLMALALALPFVRVRCGRILPS